MSMNIALSGLRAATTDLGVVSNNIANANTTGFKLSRAEFGDMVAGNSANSPGMGVQLEDISQQFKQGSVNSTGKTLDLAISGEGFFSIKQDGAALYTRAGSFDTDKDGYVVNSLGQNLQGYGVDATTGNLTSIVGNLLVDKADMEPTATTEIKTGVNLDANAIVPTIATFDPSDPSSFNSTTSLTVYDSLGNANRFDLYFIKTSTPLTWAVKATRNGGEPITPASASTGTPQTPTIYTSTVASSTIGIYRAPTDTASSAATATALNSTTAGTLDITGPAGTATGILVAVNDTAKSIAALVNAQQATTGVSAKAITQADLKITTTGGTFDLFGKNTTAQTIAIPTNSAAGLAALALAINNTTSTTGITAKINSNSNGLLLESATGDDIKINNVATGALSLQGVDQAGGLIGAAFPIDDTLPANAVSTVGGRLIYESTSSFTVTAGGGPPVTNLGSVTASLDEGSLQFDSKGLPVDSDTTTVGMQPIQLLFTVPAADLRATTGDIANGADPLLLTVDFSSTTQFGGAFSSNILTQDGYAKGRLTGMAVDKNGELSGQYNNGQSKLMGQVVLANFASVQGLQPVGDTNWAETSASGPALVGSPQTGTLGKLVPGALEASNVDLTEQLVNMISAQRNFQANSQVISTNSTLYQSILNIR
ncbi:flagellar hook-basal body complex protein [Candidatus Contendibacter odensensis]|uniref:Flagellar hook protein FlgE n=1 Tax=Candidatus Contendobacter odensis Run_B_J11 TaxID=1400861 RepID=A0A7U7G9P3_9GAMM|nr:flagellar hook-basal body complex protein [Candidatus Contendobacter odensis]CDH43776.1 putative Flagellar hook protein flgE [Candidatus Contendobacter odensis Run_B_J11]